MPPGAEDDHRGSAALSPRAAGHVVGAGAEAARHVVVTGAGSGIGRAVALRLLETGNHVALMGRDVERLRATLRATGPEGRARAAAIPCDIREREQVEAAFDQAVQLHGPLHALVANAGVGGPNAPGPQDRFMELIETNLVGTYWCLRAAESRLANGPSPRHLLVIASVLARFGVPGHSGYCASKAGLLGLVRALAVELASGGVRVNAVCPGWVDTDMASAGFRNLARELEVDEGAARQRALHAVPLRRISAPTEVAGLVAWLLSDDAIGVTGQALDVNNGAWMG
jgi:NAD(P)-dependent dehydrogenase (short-subunit alcohol dehydrogenase family)